MILRDKSPLATAVATSAAYSVTTAGSLSAITVANTNPTAAAGARTTYVTQFTLSASGGLSSAANSRIDFTFPAGTGFDGLLGNESVVDTTTSTDVGYCYEQSALMLECALDSGASAFVKAPEPESPAHAPSVATTSDPTIERVAIVWSTRRTPMSSPRLDVAP